MTDTIQSLQQKQVSDKGKSLGNLIKQVTPQGVDPKVYYELINTQIMGNDKQGKLRPVEDMLYFLNVAKKLSLDPVLKQIYPVYRWDSNLGRERMIIQTGIDGFRLIAQRTKEYGGQDDAAFTVEEVFNPVTGETVKQLKATVTVYKMVDGESLPVTASARWNEYAQKSSKGGYMGLWSSMPYNQLAKCAEALALRKAFPQDLSGLYISEELDRERTTGLDLPTPKAIEEKKAKKAEQIQEVVKEAHPQDPKPMEANFPHKQEVVKDEQGNVVAQSRQAEVKKSFEQVDINSNFSNRDNKKAEL